MVLALVCAVAVLVGGYTLRDVYLRAVAADDATIAAVGTEFRRIISWNFVAKGVIFTCSGMFQALGNIMPALISGVTRRILFAAPAIWLSSRPGFTMRQVWYLSTGTVILQMLASLWLLRRVCGRIVPSRAPIVEPMVMGA